MADSDEYFEDSFELDDAALASIQATEERFGASLTQTRSQLQAKPPSQPRSGPSSKRLKTTHSWIKPVKKHGNPQSSLATSLRRAGSMDDNPDIFVQSDGSYVLSKRGSQYPSLPQEAVKKPVFKGFQNAFTDSAPVLSKSPKRGREKIERRDEQELVSYAGEVSNDQQVPMEVERQLGSQPVAESTEWREELRRIIFTHVAPSTGMLTLQTLLSTTFPSETSPEKRRTFSETCQTIFTAFEGKHEYFRYAETSRWETHAIVDVAGAFILICELLSEARCLQPLVAVLDLMATLILHVPKFLSSFHPAKLLSVLENIVQDHLALPRPVPIDQSENGRNEESVRSALGAVVIQLMVSLYWNVKDELDEKIISCRCRILEILLHAEQLPKLIKRALQLLVLITTHTSAFLSLRSCAEFPPSPINRLHLDLIDQLCQYLVKPPPQLSHSIQQSIIAFMTLLCENLGDSSRILLDLTPLVPSVIICITELSRLLWEDNISVMNSPEEAKIVVETLYLSTTFLRNLILTSEQYINLTQRLMEVTHSSGPFNGITHMFMVTFGRLSWADIPDWLQSECKVTCETISDLAMEVTETVLVGPEFDSLWAVWHPDEEELDDEEYEAQKVQIE